MKRIMRVIILGTFAIFASSAARADISLKAFEGLWEGNATSETESSTVFPLTVREMDVEIRVKEDNSFIINWRTLQREKGDPSQPDAVLKETTRKFIPKTPGRVWKMAVTEDIYDGGTVSWAVLDTQALTIYSMILRDDGGFDMQIYRRTLTGLNMKLDFTALRNGAVRRTVSGTLIKTGK